MVRLRYPNPAGGGTSGADYEEFGYDAAGNVVSIRNRAGAVTALGYDALNRQVSIDAPAGTMDRISAYDNLGRMLTSTGDGQTLANAWDPLSRLTSESGPLGVMAYQHDAAGRMTRITWPDSIYVAYDRDLTGAVTAIRENGASSGAGVLAQFAYNDLGGTTGVTGGNGASTAYGYDAWGRLSSLSHDLAGSGSDVSFTFGWNAAGQIVRRTVSNPAYVATAEASANYGSDGLNRMTSVNGAGLSYDANQNITGVLGHTYGYDAANRLISTGSGSFGHDPAGRLYASSAPGLRFQYAGQQLAGEYDASGALVARHVPGPGLDQTVVSYVGSGLSSRAWLAGDERGSVIARTDGAATATATNTYDEFGVPGSGNAGRFQYTGQPWLPEAGAYHYRARTYRPQIGRFLQTDPISYAAGANLYAYVKADPLNLTDPFGLQETPPEVEIDCGVLANGKLSCEAEKENLTRGPAPFAGGLPGAIFGQPGTGGAVQGGGGSVNAPAAPPAAAPAPLECRVSGSGWNSFAEGATAVSNVAGGIALTSLGAAAFTSMTGVGGVSFGAIAGVAEFVSIGATGAAAAAYALDGNPAAAGATAVGGLIGYGVGASYARALVGQGIRTTSGYTAVGMVGSNVMSSVVSC